MPPAPGSWPLGFSTVSLGSERPPWQLGAVPQAGPQGLLGMASARALQPPLHNPAAWRRPLWNWVGVPAPEPQANQKIFTLRPRGVCGSQRHCDGVLLRGGEARRETCTWDARDKGGRDQRKPRRPRSTAPPGAAALQMLPPPQRSQPRTWDCGTLLHLCLFNGSCGGWELLPGSSPPPPQPPVASPHPCPAAALGSSWMTPTGCCSVPAVLRAWGGAFRGAKAPDGESVQVGIPPLLSGLAPRASGTLLFHLPPLVPSQAESINNQSVRPSARLGSSPRLQEGGTETPAEGCLPPETPAAQLLQMALLPRFCPPS